MSYWWSKEDVQLPTTCDGCGATITNKDHMHAYGDNLCGVSMILCDKCERG